MTMAKGGGKKQGKDKSASPRTKDAAPNVFDVTARLRALLNRLETRIGLFPESDGTHGHGRFHAPALLPATGAVPGGMRRIFPDELAALERIGKPADRCHSREVASLVVYCLPFYYYDGFNAVLYVERGGEFFAAWKLQEVNGESSPSEIQARSGSEDIQQALREALEQPA